jgi:methyl-accepting chemotaxis protein
MARAEIQNMAESLTKIHGMIEQMSKMPETRDNIAGLVEDFQGIVKKITHTAEASAELSQHHINLAENSTILAERAHGMAENSLLMAEKVPQMAEMVPSLRKYANGLAENISPMAESTNGLISMAEFSGMAEH